MARVKANQTNTETPKRKIRPATTPEGRENQMISLAMDLVEQRLLDGTASAQETTHFLKLGSMKARLEMKKLEEETKLSTAKAEAISSDKSNDELYIKAITYMRKYRGESDDEDDYDDY